MTVPAPKPVIGIVIGDAAGIGPEIVASSWCAGHAHRSARPVLIGSAEIMRRALAITGVQAEVKVVTEVNNLVGRPDVLEIIDVGELDADKVELGVVQRDCGAALASWLERAREMVLAGELQATVVAPVDTRSLALAEASGSLIDIREGETSLFLVSGRLRVAHLTDHIPLREVSAHITAELISRSLLQLHEALQQWGIPSPRLAVAGFNPHAVGMEEEKEIVPGILHATELGVQVRGPESPDAVFRQCIEGRYDAVLAMYHDQGHIPIKTAAFAGNYVVVLGAPQPYLMVAHGVAHDIAGQGVADDSMLASAMIAAGAMAAGRGLPDLEILNNGTGGRL